jgi:hypothetical protein
MRKPSFIHVLFPDGAVHVSDYPYAAFELAREKPKDSRPQAMTVNNSNSVDPTEEGYHKPAIPSVKRINPTNSG